MKLFRPALLTAFFALLFNVNTMYAQTDMSKWSIGFFPGILQYHGSDGNEFFKLKQSTPAVDLGVGRRLSSSFDVEGHFMGGNLDWPAQDTSSTDFSTKVFDLGAQLVYKFANGYILKEDATIAPFLYAGINGMKSDPGYGADIPLGGGINFRFDDLFSMQWRTTFKPTTRKEFNMIQHSIGFVWHLGKKEEKEVVEIAPDRDKDGVADIDDRCPDVPGIQGNNGCPEIDNETREVLSAALTGIQFQTSKDLLKAESRPILDRVVSLMQKHPEYHLFIEGHTDSSGDDGMNLDLSKRRAKTAMQYLIDHGISADRLQSEGYGETQPIADNNTKEGRARNRRVAFKILF
ncbi:MAG TPA: OmpA family protein [Bacteroidetes bacterium]|nr:OmpA family protein [Bacteroidota bacterium]